MRIAAAGLLGLALHGCSGLEEVPLVEVRRGDFRREVEAEGVLRAVTSTPIAVPHSAMGALKVIWIAEDGSYVREGDLLARFDASEIERELVEGELALSTSERKLEQRAIQEEASLSNVERDRALAELELEVSREFGQKDPEIFSRVEIIESRIDERLAAEKLEHAAKREQTERELAESDRALIAIEESVAASRVTRARDALGALELRAPHDGILVLERDWNGNTVQLGNTTYSGHTIAELPALGRMEAAVYVLEADAGGLTEGALATVAVEGRPGESFEATIRRVDRMPKPRVRGTPVQYFEATLELGTADSDGLKPGQRVRAKLVLEELHSVLTLPRQAVLDEGDGFFVYRDRGGVLAKVPVTLGPASLGRIVVTSGLAEGDRVAARDPERSRGELVPGSEEIPAEGTTP